MSTPDDQEAARRVRALNQIEPNAEATRRAVERVRSTLLNQPNVNTARPTADRPSWRLLMATRIACTSAAAACLVGLVVWLGLSGPWESIAFADVQEQLERMENVTLKVSALGKRQAEWVPHVGRMTTTRSGMARGEMSNGDVVVLNPKQGRCLQLKVKEKKAVLGTVFPRQKTSLFQKLRKIHKDPIKRLPDREIDGKRAIGFLVVLEETEFPSGTEASVWVDPHTRLPVRLEMNEISSAGGNPAPGPMIVMDEIVFDRQLDESLFDTTPPAGYTVDSSELAKFEGQPLPPLVLTPKVGIGDVRFGMSKEEVIQILGPPELIRQKWGEPEQFEQQLENTPIEQTSVRKMLRETIARWKQNPYYLVGFDELKYNASGLWIFVDPDDGVTSITAHSQETSGGGCQGFIGRTKEGIALGASLEEIQKAYGEPSVNDASQFMLANVKQGGFGAIFYPDLGLTFTLNDSKLTRFSAVPVVDSDTSPTQPAGQPVDPDLEIDIDPYSVIKGRDPMRPTERPADPVRTEY